SAEPRRIFTPRASRCRSGFRKHSVATFLSALVAGLGEGSVVSSLHCMNDPQAAGSHGKPHRTTKILSHARWRGGMAVHGARAAARAHAADRRADALPRE